VLELSPIISNRTTEYNTLLHSDKKDATIATTTKTEVKEDVILQDGLFPTIKLRVLIY
jgi:hypothetical protein